MSKITRFGISIDSRLLESFDRQISKKGYKNRSEAIRDLIRDDLVQEEWELGTTETVGTISLVFNHNTRELADVLTELQHRYYQSIISTIHIHLDRYHCLEVLAIKGKAQNIKKIADKLIGTKGVKYGKLSAATTGKDLA